MSQGNTEEIEMTVPTHHKRRLTYAKKQEQVKILSDPDRPLQKIIKNARFNRDRTEVPAYDSALLRKRSRERVTLLRKKNSRPHT